MSIEWVLLVCRVCAVYFFVLRFAGLRSKLLGVKLRKEQRSGTSNRGTGGSHFGEQPHILWETWVGINESNIARKGSAALS